MLNWFFSHNWKSIKRSPDFHRNLAVNIFFGFLIFIGLLEFLMVGIFLPRIIKEDLLPGSDPLKVFNSALIFYFGLEFILRLIFQNLKLIDAKRYLLLKIDRKEITGYILFRSLLTIINAFPLILIIPFFFTGVLPSTGLLSALVWLITLLSLLIFNTYLANYSKLRYFKNPVRTFILTGILILFVGLEYYRIISTTYFSLYIFTLLLEYPSLVIIPLSAIYLIYRLNADFIFKNLSLDEISSGKARKINTGSYKFLTTLGKTGALISLELKMLLRHKRTKSILIMSVAFVLYGLVFYTNPEFSGRNNFGYFMLLFCGSFISGLFIFSYGIQTFGMEGKHFGIMITNRIEIISYIKAKYYLMVLMSTINYLISLFYIYFGLQVFFINSMTFLFNTGVAAYFFLFLATYNKVSLNLNAGMNSMQGKGGNQFFGVFLYIILMLLVFLPFSIFLNKLSGALAMGMLGLLGLIFRNRILDLMLKQFNRRKYIMSEGFRQTQ
jgi:hypothetical protein